MAEAGEDTEHFHWLGTRLLLASMVFLGIGLSADVVVVMQKMGVPLFWSFLVGVTLLFSSYGLWFGVAFLRHPARGL
jgi:hypothetical protein